MSNNEPKRKYENIDELVSKFKVKFVDLSDFSEKNDVRTYDIKTFYNFIEEVKNQQDIYLKLSEVKKKIENEPETHPFLIIYSENRSEIFVDTKVNSARPFYVIFAEIYKLNFLPSEGLVVFPDFNNTEDFYTEFMAAFKWLFDDGFANFINSKAGGKDVFRKFGVPESIIKARFKNGWL